MSTNNPKLQIKISATNEELRAKLAEADKQMKGFASKMNTLSNIGAGVVGALGVAAIADQLKMAYVAAEEVTKVNQKLEAVLKATGYAAGLTSAEIDNMASSMMELSGIDDEVIKSAQTVLLTFTNVGKEVFPQATQAALDMSAVMGQDLQSSIVQIGKALNDPIAGVTALRRVGVQLTGQQKDQIEVLVKQNKGLEAQQIILAELQKEFGGAAAASKTFSQEMTTAIGNLQESFGSLMQGENAITTYLRNLANGWQIIIDKIRITATETKNLGFADTQEKLRDVGITKFELEEKFGKKKLNTKINMINGIPLTDFDATKIKYQSLIKEEKILTRQAQALFGQQETQKRLAALAAKNAGKNFNLGSDEKNGSKKTTIPQSAKDYEKFMQSANDKFFERTNEIDTMTALGYVGISKNNPLFNEYKSTIMDFNKEIRDIELSEARNKEELKLQVANFYKNKALDLNKQYKAAVSEEDRKQMQASEEFSAKALIDVAQYRTQAINEEQKKMADEAKKRSDETAESWSRAFNRIFDHSLTWKQRLGAIFEELAMQQLKMLAIQQLTPIAEREGKWTTAAKFGLKLAGAFAEGGVVPGNFSQPVPILAHGSEMILNPSQQGNLMDMLNSGNGGSGKTTSQPIIVNTTIAIKTLDGKEAGNAIMGQKNLIQQMVADGIRKGTNGLKMASRSA